MFLKKCPLCDFVPPKETHPQKSITIHARHAHNLKSEDFYIKYLKKEGEGLCKKCGIGTKYISSIQGYAKYCAPCYEEITNKGINTNNPELLKEKAERFKKKIEARERILKNLSIEKISRAKKKDVIF